MLTYETLKIRMIGVARIVHGVLGMIVSCAWLFILCAMLMVVLDVVYYLYAQHMLIYPDVWGVLVTLFMVAGIRSTWVDITGART